MGDIGQTPPPPPPRPLTPRVLRRSWFEPHVRFWWLFALFLFVSSVVYAISAISNLKADRQLIEHGTVVDAMVGGIGGHQRPPETSFDLTFTLNGQSYTVTGVLEGRKEFVTEGTTVPIRVDPNDPSRWTYRTEIDPLSSGVLAALLAAATGGLMLGVAWMRRRRVLRIYQEGQAVLVQIASLTHSSLAPQSRSARFSRHGGREKELHAVILPPHQAKEAVPGALLWVYALGGKLNRAVSAAMFD